MKNIVQNIASLRIGKHRIVKKKQTSPTPRYDRLALDIKENGYSEANMPLEVGCRGVIDKRNALTLETICNLVGIKAQQRLKGALAWIALLGPYQIYLARKSPEWSGGDLI